MSKTLLTLSLLLVGVLVFTDACDNMCPDGNCCSMDSTCCRMSDGNYGCCPHRQAVCCSDMMHCCPHGYECNGRRCMRGDEEIEASKIMQNEVEVKSSCHGGGSCPGRMTCCEMSGGHHMCCRHAGGVCCKDGRHCCPRGSRCNSMGNRCMRGDDEFESTVMMFGQEEEEDERMSCSGHGSCPDGSMCCMMKSGRGRCCRHRNGMCCKNSMHCCPMGMRCSDDGRRCMRDVSIF